MQTFKYQALDASGKTVRDLIQADSERQARQLLRDRGLFPRQLASTTSSASGEVGEKKSTRGSRRRLNHAERVELTRQLATLVGAALPLAESLQLLAEQSTQPRLRAVLLQLLASVQEGHSLADSLRQSGGQFNAMYCALVAAGERSGRLGLVLERLADYQEQVQKQRHKAMTALIYPAALLFVSLAVVVGLMSFVVPKLTEQFIDSGQALPLLTRILIVLSDAVLTFGPLALVLLALGVVVAVILLRKPAWALRRDRALLRLPRLGGLLVLLDSARLSRSLAILVSSGVPLLDALRVSVDTLGNRVLQAALRDSCQDLRGGTSLYRALGQSGHFPPLLVNMVASGEASGRLDEMLDRVASHQERSFGQRVDTTLALFEPVMILCMGSLVLFIVLAILLPIMQLNQALNF
ncbi:MULTISPECIES: type II secretion system inner membrane protein GspF [Marinobacterium]|uniref:General secretion pathway protein F n=2 Tax=Marinobacterium TaxID=48075 RepID=A0A1H6DF45_9GAMM|nr:MULTISPECIES: type II secretion system inner membrane protein GspF [Marinobacterium]TCK03541.1 type II secretion system protein F (GspF) [Marinobacterium mangrovicola]SEG84057.1 type II secretion system protein F (GspF) [Marinobacterium lutimaris]